MVVDQSVVRLGTPWLDSGNTADFCLTVGPCCLIGGELAGPWIADPEGRWELYIGWWGTYRLGGDTKAFNRSDAGIGPL